MDYSLGKHVTSAARWAVVVVVLLSPALVHAQGRNQRSEQLARSLDIQFAQFEGPPVEVPVPTVEGMVEIPADGPLVGDMIEMPGESVTESQVMSAPPVTSSESPSHYELTPYSGFDPQGTSYVQHANGGPAPVFSTGSWFETGQWYVNADFVVLKKDAPSERHVAIDPSTLVVSTSAGGFTLDNTLSTETETHEFESGARITFGKFLGRDAARRDHMVDFTFFGFFDWVAQAELVGENLNTALSLGDLRLLFTGGPLFVPITGFIGSDRQTYRYSSDFDSLELSYRIRTRPGRDQMAIHPSGVWTRHASSGQLRGFSAGLRGLSINEGFLSEAFSGSDRTGMYRVRTGNDLFGPQLGIDLIESRDLWHCGFRTKLGTLLNFADRRTEVEVMTEPPGVGEVITERAERSDEEQLSFLAQVGMYGAVHLRPNLSIRAAYDVIYITGLGIAPNNAKLGESDFPGFSTTGDALYHGGSLGFVTQF